MEQIQTRIGGRKNKEKQIPMATIQGMVFPIKMTPKAKNTS